jgi:putative alpha-1,2-mannosidase
MALLLRSEGYRSRFNKSDETAKPGYYAVQLKDYGVRAELTATPRVAYHRFVFPATNQAHILFDVGGRQGESGAVLDALVRRAGPRELEGSLATHPEYIKAYQPGALMRLYFVARLDQTPLHWGTFRGAEVFPHESRTPDIAGYNRHIWGIFHPGGRTQTCPFFESHYSEHGADQLDRLIRPPVRQRGLWHGAFSQATLI